jgi:broad specificity phosphatase PhoE
VSDLHCAARILLACPGDAEFEPARPASSGGSLTREGRVQADGLGRSLAAARLALVYTAPQSRAVQTAEIVAGRTGASVAVREGLGERSAVTELDAIVDVHRGETVLVVLPGKAIRATVPALVGLRDDLLDSLPAGHCDVVELAADADGWVLRSRGDDPVAAETPER